MKRVIIEEKLRPGMIMQARMNTAFGRVTRFCLTRWLRREQGKNPPPVWGSHTALVVQIHNALYIGDAAPPFAAARPTDKWNEWIRSGHAEVRFFEVIGATVDQEHAASSWWIRNVLGKIYDYLAFPRLLFKSMVKSLFKRAYGWEWAWFCTEGVGRAWEEAVRKSPGPFGKDQATPLTIEKRAGLYGDPQPTLREITVDVTRDEED